MDRNPSPPAPRVYTEAQPSTIFVYADIESFMETVRRTTGQTASTNAAADRGAIVQMLPLEPVQQHQSMLATATALAPRTIGLGSQVTLSPPLSMDNPGPSVSNMAPNPLSLANSSSASTISEEDEEMESAEEVETEDVEEVEAIKEGRFYLLRPPTGEPKLLALFPLGPSSTEGD